jgi:hypothetical protein
MLVPLVICSLGALWRELPEDQRQRYEDMARRLDAEHKRQYPGE